IYGLASVIQRSIMSIYPPTASQLISSLYNKLIKSQIKAYDEPNLPLLPNPNVDIEMLDQSSENENKLFNTLESKKYISDDSNIMEFNLNVNNNDCELSSLSSYTIDNEKRFQCKCGKIIKLHQAYNPKNLEKHNKTNNCLLTKGIHPLTSYFINSTKSKQILCIGLKGKKHLKYLQRIGGIIHYDKALCVEVLAKELFSKKVNKNFCWKKLTNNEKIKLENELVARAKWRNDFNSNLTKF
ncbi:12925_t:CDS:2, partial [Funneliformis geosporum]